MKKVIFALLLLAGISAAFVGCKTKDQAKDPEPDPVVPEATSGKATFSVYQYDSLTTYCTPLMTITCEGKTDTLGNPYLKEGKRPTLNDDYALCFMLAGEDDLLKDTTIISRYDVEYEVTYGKTYTVKVEYSEGTYTPQAKDVPFFFLRGLSVVAHPTVNLSGVNKTMVDNAENWLDYLAICIDTQSFTPLAKIPDAPVE